MSAAKARVRGQWSDAHADENVAAVAADIDDRFQVSARAERWQPYTAGLGDGLSPHAPCGRDAPLLILDDISEIPFLQGIAGVEFYQLRARVRAGDGGLYAATCPEVPGYEAYNASKLGLGRPEFIFADGGDNLAAVSEACQHGAAFERLVDVASDGGQLTFHPYMGNRTTWELAEKIATVASATASAVDVRVIAPPPPVTEIANDKVILDLIVRAVCDDDVLGGPPVVDSSACETPAEMAAAMDELAQRHERVALKMPRCASAMGNEVFRAADVREHGGAWAAERFIAAKDWKPGEAVMAVAWERTTSSPSTQLWIPPLGSGHPRVDGVYEQLLEGEAQVFQGAVPSRLGTHEDQRLAEASLRVARVFQALGYVGRCSFDFICFDGRAAFVECNGRWGGTSTPMHLVERLRTPVGQAPLQSAAARGAYRAMDVISPALGSVPLSEIVSCLGDSLFDVATQTGRFALYNVGCLPGHGKLDVLAFGDSLDDAARALDEELPRRLRPLGV